MSPLHSLANIPLTPETARDQERRIRREIANSNERRRMQSINAGFQSLKTLIPHSDGEKLSKVSQTNRESGNQVLSWMITSLSLTHPHEMKRLRSTTEVVNVTHNAIVQLFLNNTSVVCEIF